MSGRERRPILGLNAFSEEASGGLDAALRRMVDRRMRSAGPSSILLYKTPLHVASAEGARIRTADGREYLDFYNNVPSVGHGDPRVAEAVHRRMLTANSHSRYLTDVVETYAERLLATMPAPIAHVTFTCTGSEANDLALRMARISSGRRGVVVTRGAYHGNTAAVTEISPSSFKRGAPPPFVKLVDAPSREAYGEDVAGGFAGAVVRAIRQLDAEGHGFAAFVVDTIFSSDGVYADPAGFLAPAVEAARVAGGFFIADEIQPGFGRTGAGMWGFARHGVAPDMVTTGKPMANGYPLGAVFTRPGLLARLQEEFGYFNTFGGAPAGAAAGLAVLDAIESGRLIEGAATNGALLKERLTALARRYPALADVRGAGLYVGVSIRPPAGASVVNEDPTVRIVNALKEKGVLIGVAGLSADVLKIRPPLVVTPADIGILVDRLEAVLSELGYG